MDNKTKISSLAESRVISELIKQDYHVFTQFSGKAPFDMVVYKNNTLIKVEVKSTTRRTKYNTGWSVLLKKVRSNKSLNKIYLFDNSSCDLLAVYIEPIDKVILLKANEILAKNELVIKDNLEV